MRFPPCFADAIILLTLLASTTDSLAQTASTSRPQRRYMRPSWTTMVAAESGEKEKLVLAPFKDLGLTSKFNDHGIGSPEVNCSGGDNAARDASVQRAVSAHGPSIVGKWFDRAEDGTMSAKVVMERGRYSQDDMDRMIQLHSTVDRSGAQGWQLLDLTYVVVYDVSKVEYRRDAVKTTDKKSGSSKGGGFLDALNKAAGGNAPSTPSSSGSTKYVDVYRIEYTADLYKLQWNDTVEWQFVQRFWNPREAPDAAKAAAWSEASFPLTKVTSFKDFLTSRDNVQQSDPPHDELLAKFATRMQKIAVERFSKKVSELRPRAPVVEVYPLTARLGTKEDVKVNDRFVAFEYKQGRKGYSMKRKGVVRAYKVTRNQEEADGRTKPSTFQQQGGWKVWPGMSIEERHDMGVNVSGGIQSSPDPLSNGLSFNLKSNVLGQAFKFPNFYLGITFAKTMATGLDASGLIMPYRLDSLLSTTDAPLNPSEWKGQGHQIGGTLSKEFYISNRGNFFLEPTFGVSAVAWRFTGNGSSNFNDDTFTKAGQSNTKWSGNAENAFSYKSTLWSLGCGVGHHFGPIAIELRPMIGLRRPFKYKDAESNWRQAVDPDGQVVREGAVLSDDASDLAKDFKNAFAPSIVAAVRVRF